MEAATADGPAFDSQRHSGPPVVTREEPVAAPATRLESLGIFVGFSILYTVLGFHIASDLHVINFDALDRLTRAFMVWYNDPPKLASIGFSLPPIGTLVLVPFAAFRGLVTSGLALPLSSALFAAGTLVFISRMFAMADMLRGPRLLLVLLIGVNPMFAFYAMNGTGDAAGLMFVGFGLFCVLGWGRNGSPRYLIGGGLAFALASLTLYEYIFWAVFIAFLISFTLSARDRDEVEVEGSVIAYLAPIFYALGIWIFFNAVVLGDPVAWVSQASGSAPVNALSSSAPGVHRDRCGRQRPADPTRLPGCAAGAADAALRGPRRRRHRPGNADPHQHRILDRLGCDRRVRRCDRTPQRAPGVRGRLGRHGLGLLQGRVDARPGLGGDRRALGAGDTARLVSDAVVPSPEPRAGLHPCGLLERRPGGNELAGRVPGRYRAGADDGQLHRKPRHLDQSDPHRQRPDVRRDLADRAAPSCSSTGSTRATKSGSGSWPIRTGTSATCSSRRPTRT